MESEFLIAGLGNPGAAYAETRHNIGFMVADALAAELGIRFNKSQFNAEQGRKTGKQRLTLIKPMSFMNKSGMPVQNVSRFFDIAPTQIIVAHDDLDLPFGDVRLKKGGGHGGHNGLRSIIQTLGTGDFMRLRMGIGRPQFGDPADYVLGHFTPAEKAALDDFIRGGVAALEYLFAHGIAKAMTSINQRDKPSAARHPGASSLCYRPTCMC